MTQGLPDWMANVLLLVMVGAMTAPLMLTAARGGSSHESNMESAVSDLQVVQDAAMEMTDLPTMAQSASEAPMDPVGPITQTPP
jgi:hypothetical protein